MCGGSRLSRLRQERVFGEAPGSLGAVSWRLTQNSALLLAALLLECKFSKISAAPWRLRDCSFSRIQWNRPA